MQVLFKFVTLPFKVMRFFALAPVKIVKFMLDNALLLGIYAVIRLTFKLLYRIFTTPFTLGLLLGGSGIFVMVDADRRKKVMEMLGL